MKERRYTDEEAAFWRAQVEVKDTQLQAHRTFVTAFGVWKKRWGLHQHTTTEWSRMMDALKALELDVHDEPPEVRAIHDTP